MATVTGKKQGWEERDGRDGLDPDLGAPSTSLPDLALGYTAPARAHKGKDDMKLFGQRRQKRLKSLNGYVTKFTSQLTELIDRRRQKNLHFAAEAIFYANKIDSKLEKEDKSSKFDNVSASDNGTGVGARASKSEMSGMGTTNGERVIKSEEWHTDVPIKKNIPTLKWVKQLVNYTESYPVFAANSSSLPSNSRRGAGAACAMSPGRLPPAQGRGERGRRGARSAGAAERNQSTETTAP